MALTRRRFTALIEAGFIIDWNLLKTRFFSINPSKLPQWVWDLSLIIFAFIVGTLVMWLTIILVTILLFLIISRGLPNGNIAHFF